MGEQIIEEVQQEEVLFERRGHLGIVTLNRPRAVNALNAGMVKAMLQQLAAWADDESVAAVLVRGAGDRGLCAGGDIVAIYKDGQVVLRQREKVLQGNSVVYNARVPQRADRIVFVYQRGKKDPCAASRSRVKVS